LVDVELAATVTATTAWLDQVASLGGVLPADQRAAWADDLDEIEEMAREIDAYLRGAGTTGDST
jgi:hypothetical protein